jgi:hypothetical protein
MGPVLVRRAAKDDEVDAWILAGDALEDRERP